MTMFEASLKRTRLARPTIILAATLVAGLILALLPACAVEPLARFTAWCSNRGKSWPAGWRRMALRWSSGPAIPPPPPKKFRS